MRVLMSMILLASCMPASAEVYKCTTGGVTSYQAQPCSDKARPIELNVHHPDARERALARQRAMADRRDAAGVDAERARIAYERDVDRAQRASREAAHDSKCANIQSRAKAAEHERDLYATQRFRDDAERRKREYDAQHFSECFAR